MKLDKHVVDMFTELTKPADDVKMEKTCYGVISVVDGTRYVKLDGSDLLVPAASTVKTSHGDRVTVLMKNHSLTITGNLTAPATDSGGSSSGEAGTAATIEVGTVTTGEAGTSASVTNSGTTSAAVFDFVIPRGDKGEKGDTGPQGPQGEAGTAATIEVATVTTLKPGSLAYVTNSGTASAAVLHLAIPQGEKGDTGPQGPQGEKGDTGPQGPQGEKGDTGTWDGAIPDHEHSVSDITDFPTSLPANGGNADTLDGFHANDIISGYTSWENYTSIPNNSDLNSYTTNGLYISATASTSATLSNYPSTGMGFYFEVYFRSSSNITQILMRWEGVEYRRYCLSGTWSDWQRLNDGGNADTLDGFHATAFVQQIELGNIETDTKSAIGISGKFTVYRCVKWTDYPTEFPDSQGTLIAINYGGSGIVGTNNIWCTQYMISPIIGSHIFKRVIRNVTITEWVDCMNMGYLSTDRTAIEEGDLDGITVPGKYIVSSADFAANISNSPWSSIGYYLDVYKRSESYVLQVATNWMGAIKKRYIAGTAWAPWSSMIDNTTFDALEARVAALEAK